LPQARIVSPSSSLALSVVLPPEKQAAAALQEQWDNEDVESLSSLPASTAQMDLQEIKARTMFQMVEDIV